MDEGGGSIPFTRRRSAVIASLRDRHGEATACKRARLKQLKARHARSRQRFDFWTAVGRQMEQGRLDCEPTRSNGLRKLAS